ncbi:MAG TPA: hypothetical protein VHK06_05795, partial [Candidatus Limnocylindria bacterium]|nr:hypothetical protein [Candidatus Limnocylindria bacterium]
MPLQRGAGGTAWYDPGELLATVGATARQALDAIGGRERVAGIGVAGMAESGLLLDATISVSGSPDGSRRSPDSAMPATPMPATRSPPPIASSACRAVARTVA